MSKEFGIPVLLDLSEKSVLIVGGGRVAQRKYDQLKRSCKDLTVLIKQGTSTPIDSNVMEASYHADLLKPFDLVLACTDDHGLNKTVVFEARALKKLAYDASDHTNSDLTFMAYGKVRNILLGISTLGQAPGMAKDLVSHIIKNMDDLWFERMALIGQLRKPLIQAQRHELLKTVYTMDIEELRSLVENEN